ncbi:hypothetical protein F485_gp156 [Aeromonas phage CC2]|uniref:Uncharacterized protein n=1 Tax=Aeromonas phage CC2 TaxID=1204516 RepID=I6XGN8_9CAUD|nr:hypothetical protein F485_gp156 [Aeromonas phage CC2]AFN39231.1 hypothetical protein CC2_140 [Aeromonas phage CC2]
MKYEIKLEYVLENTKIEWVQRTIRGDLPTADEKYVLLKLVTALKSPLVDTILVDIEELQIIERYI